MANRDNPMGFRPARGIGSNVVESLFPVDVANGTNFFVGDVADLDPNGGVIPAAADAGVSAAGVVTALYDTNMIPVGAPGSAVTTKYLPLSTRGYALVALAIPGTVFIAQDDAAAALAEEDIGQTTDHVAGAGSTTTAVSNHELNGTVGGLQFRILGLVNKPGNAWGSNAEVYVTFNESAFGVSAAAAV